VKNLSKHQPSRLAGHQSSQPALSTFALRSELIQRRLLNLSWNTGENLVTAKDGGDLVQILVVINSAWQLGLSIFRGFCGHGSKFGYQTKHHQLGLGPSLCKLKSVRHVSNN